MSYPIGAEALSIALEGVPQSALISIAFGPALYALSRRPGHASRYTVLSGVYRHCLPNQFSPNHMLERGHYEPQWELRVNEVPRLHRHAVRTLLANEGLPRLRDWLVSLACVTGREGHYSMVLGFDESQQTLNYDDNKH